MTRRAVAPLLAIACWSVPSAAFAAGASAGEPVVWTMGLLTLVAAVVLLVIALGLARVAEGSTMADNISYVVVACVCLAGSVLAQWAARLAVDPDVAAQIVIGGQALVIVAIALFCVYFFRVRAALRRFLSSASSDDSLAQAHVPQGGAGPSNGPEGGPGGGAGDV